MAVPEEDHPLLRRLAEFLGSDSLEDFRKDARRRCASLDHFFEAGGGSLETSSFFPDYLAFSHRDADGRIGVDIFLREVGPSLDPEERAAFERMRETVFGPFAIEERVPSGLRVRYVGTDDRFEVTVNFDVKESPPGNGFVARLVPCGKVHLVTGYCLSLSAKMVSELERLARAANPEAMRRLYVNPIGFLEIMLAGFLMKRPPENLREAEIHAAPIFTAADFPFTVEEVKDRFRRSRDGIEILEDCGLIRVRNAEEFKRLMEALVFLWNYLPRDELGGRPPAEEGRGCAGGEAHSKGPTCEVTFEKVDGEYGRVRLRHPGEHPPDHPGSSG